MSDLIDRQALLKQIDIDSDGEPGYYGDTWKFIDTIKSMPNVHDLPKDADTISRQAVKELAHKQICEKYCGMAFKKHRDFYIKLADSIIDLLPSAQPEQTVHKTEIKRPKSLGFDVIGGWR